MKVYLLAIKIVLSSSVSALAQSSPQNLYAAPGQPVSSQTNRFTKDKLNAKTVIARFWLSQDLSFQKEARQDLNRLIHQRLNLRKKLESNFPIIHREGGAVPFGLWRAQLLINADGSVETLSVTRKIWSSVLRNGTIETEEGKYSPTAMAIFIAEARRVLSTVQFEAGHESQSLVVEFDM